MEIEIFMDKGLTRFKDLRVFGLRDLRIKRFRGAMTKKNGKIWEKFPKGGGG